MARIRGRPQGNGKHDRYRHKPTEPAKKLGHDYIAGFFKRLALKEAEIINYYHKYSKVSYPGQDNRICKITVNGYGLEKNAFFSPKKPLG